MWLALSGWRALSIKAEPYTEKFFSPDYPIQKFLDIRQGDLYNDQGIYVSFFYGVEQQLADPGNVTMWDTTYEGEAVFKSDFNISAPQA